jgi:hypothetical protein
MSEDDNEDLYGMTVVQLKRILKANGLTQVGVKRELILKIIDMRAEIYRKKNEKKATPPKVRGAYIPNDRDRISMVIKDLKFGLEAYGFENPKLKYNKDDDTVCIKMQHPMPDHPANLPVAEIYKKLTIDELKKLLRKYKLPVSGSKQELYRRLLDYDEEN